MTQVQRRAVRGIAATAGMALALALTGCGNFFVCDKASCTTSGGGGNTAAGNVAYVANSSSGSTYISGYTLSKGTLAAATSSPRSLGITPTSMVVSRNNNYLYLASTISATGGASGIYGLSIGTGGALTFLAGANPLTGQSATAISALDVSPDGNWLIATTAPDPNNHSSLAVYPLSSSTGLITGNPLTAPPYSPAAGSLIYALKIAPSGEFITVALGTGGFVTFPFDTSTGALGTGTALGFPSGGAFDLAIDSNNLLYVAGTGSAYVFTVSTKGVPTPQAVASATTDSTAPFSLALDGTSYLYASASNGTSNLIHCFSIAKSGALTQLSTATIAGPPSASKMAVDSTGAYLLAAGYDSSAGLKLYSITSTTGVLTSLDTAATGTSNLVQSALALSH